VYRVLYSEIALPWKPVGIGHVYIYTFLFRMTDTMTSQNIDLSSWDTLYINIAIRLRAGLSRNQGLISGGVRDMYLPHSVETVSGAHRVMLSTSYWWP
jgi:hypothetical protein